MILCLYAHVERLKLAFWLLKYCFFIQKTNGFVSERVGNVKGGGGILKETFYRFSFDSIVVLRVFYLNFLCLTLYVLMLLTCFKLQMFNIPISFFLLKICLHRVNKHNKNKPEINPFGVVFVNMIKSCIYDQKEISCCSNTNCTSHKTQYSNSLFLSLVIIFLQELFLIILRTFCENAKH